MTNPLDSVDQYLMAGGGGAPSAFNKFDGPGTKRGGRIVKRELTQQTKFGTGAPLFFDADKTKPRQQIEITVETDLRDPERDQDNGHRRIFIKGSYLEGELREAIKAARAPGLQVGGTLHLTRLRQVERQSAAGSYDDWDVKIEYAPPAPEVDAYLGATAKAGNGQPAATNGAPEPSQLGQNGGYNPTAYAQQAPQNAGQPGVGQFAQPGMAPGSGYAQLPGQTTQQVPPAAPSQTVPAANTAPASGGLTEAELSRLAPEQRAAIPGMLLSGMLTEAQIRIMFAAQLAGA